jgi:hypothetical protein
MRFANTASWQTGWCMPPPHTHTHSPHNTHRASRSVMLRWTLRARTQPLHNDHPCIRRPLLPPSQQDPLARMVGARWSPVQANAHAFERAKMAACVHLNSQLDTHTHTHKRTQPRTTHDTTQRRNTTASGPSGTVCALAARKQSLHTSTTTHRACMHMRMHTRTTRASHNNKGPPSMQGSAGSKPAHTRRQRLKKVTKAAGHIHMRNMTRTGHCIAVESCCVLLGRRASASVGQKVSRGVEEVACRGRLQGSAHCAAAGCGHHTHETRKPRAHTRTRAGTHAHGAASGACTADAPVGRGAHTHRGSTPTPCRAPITMDAPAAMLSSAQRSAGTPAAHTCAALKTHEQQSV